MALISIKGKVNNSKQDFVRLNLPLGTETVATAVPANNIGILIDSGVNLESGDLERTVKRLIEALREARYSMT